MSKIFPSDYDEKTTIAADDMVLFSDSEDSDKLKKAKYSNLKWETWATGATWATWATWATGATWPAWPTWPQWPAWADGADGTDWADGNWIASITSNKVWKTTTVTITETDTTITTFDIEDWADWAWSWDVMWPATNTDSYIPQRDWANSKTLKNGLAVPAGWLAWLTSPSFTTPDINAATADSIQAWQTSAWVLIKNNDWTTVASFWVGSTSSTNIALWWATVVTGNISATNLSWTNTGDQTRDSLWLDTDDSPQFAWIELWNASDTSLTRSAAWVLAVEWVVIPSISSTNTLTNKRINQRVVSAASYTTDTGTSLDVSTCDIFVVTAQAWALKLNNPSGTPTNWQKLIVRIKDNWTARALTYDTQFRAMWTALPSTTVLSKTLYLGFIYNSDDTKRDLVAAAQET